MQQRGITRWQYIYVCIIVKIPYVIMLGFIRSRHGLQSVLDCLICSISANIAWSKTYIAWHRSLFSVSGCHGVSTDGLFPNTRVRIGWLFSRSLRCLFEYYSCRFDLRIRQ